MSASKDLIDSIKIIYDNNIKNATFDKTYNGKISNVNSDGSYNVIINGVEYTNVKTMGGTCSLNELVKIRVPQNNYNNMYIDKHGNSSGSDTVNSVNGKTGNVILNQDDIGNGNTYVRTHNDFTNDYKSQIDTNKNNITDLQNDKLDKNGDSSNTTVSFTQSTNRSNVSTGEKLSILLGKISKWFADLGSLAFKSEVIKSDLSSSVQSSLDKADSALQSYTETDPTVPSWAKEDSKPTYTKEEIGLGNVDNKSSETIRGEITSNNVTSALGYTPLNSNLKGANNGLAELDDNGLIPSSQLPSYVDDVVEGYYYNSKFYQDTTHSQLINGESSKIYISLDTNVEYRWSGSQYVEISSSLALGETSSTAYRGDRGKIAYDHSQLTSGNPHNVNKTDIGLSNVDNTADANKNVLFATSSESTTKDANGNVIDTTYATKTELNNHKNDTSNPHKVTKSQVGLSNVENYKAVSTVANQGLSDTEKSNARTNIGAGTSSFSGSYNDLTNKPVIDSSLSGSSTNAIQNKVVNNALNNKVSYNDVLQTTNSFGGEKLYISKIDNAFYCANFRWNVKAELFKTSDNSLVATLNSKPIFDGDYESYIQGTDGQYIYITMDFNGTFPGYPYGYMYMSFYYMGKPSAMPTGRVYCTYAPQGVGWHDITFNNYIGNITTGDSNFVIRARNNFYGITKIEIKVPCMKNGNYNTSITQLEMQLDRPYSGRNPFLSKYAEETLYYNLNAPSFTGDLIGNASTSTKATQDGEGNVITSTYATKSSLSTVATSGDYSDLSNKPTIPTVNNGTLTIQKNGSDIATFNANSSTNQTANITVPTKTSDLTNDNGFITSIPIGGTNIGGVKNGGNVTINSDGTMNASGTGNGDMLKANYATKSNTIVDEAYNSLSLGGKSANTFILSTDEGTAVDPNPINADTLNGHYANEFVMTNTEDFLKPTDVVDNLTSTYNEKPLSANQGNVLNTIINQLSIQKASIESPNFIGTPTVSSNTNYTTRQLRNIMLSTSEPTSTDGQNGDIWIVYGG